jgi:hypothetical protein
MMRATEFMKKKFKRYIKKRETDRQREPESERERERR